MNRTLLRRTAAGLGTLLTAATLPLALATPAQATAPQCMNYLHSKGYKVGPKVRVSCKAAEAGQLQKCADGLKSIEVTASHANTACRKGAR